MDDVITNKIAIIKNCIKRIHEEYTGQEDQFDYNYTKQDSVVLNLQRACEAAIDLGARMISMSDLGLPQSSREVFQILEKNGYISKELALKMQAMVGFRNIAVHDYQKVNLQIVKSIISSHLSDFTNFAEAIQKIK